ncbi:hypothetical protein ERJ75_001782400 [Trypanosoma vivax]|nr:hypothetical protein ERJ75_001782400 [Trypanosoma vivax]
MRGTEWTKLMKVRQKVRQGRAARRGESRRRKEAALKCRGGFTAGTTVKTGRSGHKKREERTVKLLFVETRDNGRKIANAENANREQLKRRQGREGLLVALARADYTRGACICIATGHGTKETKARLRRRKRSEQGTDADRLEPRNRTIQSREERRESGEQGRQECDEGLPRRGKGQCAGHAFGGAPEQEETTTGDNQRALRDWACARRPKRATSDLSGRVQPGEEQAEKRTAKAYASGATEKPRVERTGKGERGTKKKGERGE